MSVEGTGPDPTYWGYQRRLAREFVIPLLEGEIGPIRNRTLLDLGCGEGGVALEAGAAGAVAVGVDLDASRVERGRILAEVEGFDVDLRIADVNDGTFPEMDIVVLRDVIEHLAEPEVFLAGLHRHLKPTGVVYVSFPPYYSPFGLHQQLLPGPWMRRMPWLSLLPPTLVRERVAKGPHADDIRDLARCRLTIRGFETAVKRAGFEPVRRRGYLLRPAHAVRFGWPVVPAGPLVCVPGPRVIFVSGVSYLLRGAPAAR